jgi:2'-5' RNA ligase
MLMAFALEMYFDAAAAATVRRIWALLESRGVASAGSGPFVDARPHISLCVFDSAPMDAVERIVSTRASQLQNLSVVLSSLGFFMTAESVAFLGVTPTERLLRVQRAVAAEVLPIAVGYWNYYRPDAFVPHCTLASNVCDFAATVDAVATAALPVIATIASVGAIEVPSGKVQFHIRYRTSAASRNVG